MEVLAWPEHTVGPFAGSGHYSANAGSSHFVGFGDVFLVRPRSPLKNIGASAAPPASLLPARRTLVFEA